ncbi:MAG TPA: 50S ribosomal protein L24 [Candidatus Methylomirabilis sp.]|nr:50S ribosomal protein L24 [Candidatus Methylomirabilis sp.]
MKIKRNDNVRIIAGKDKGKEGKVLQIFADKNKASIEGLNLLIKHLRPRKQGEKGQRIEFPAPLAISNLALICPNCGKLTRVGYKFSEETVAEGKKIKKKVRICKKCNKAIE